MIIEFGSWRLEPCGDLNWQLMRKRPIERGKRAGQLAWVPVGRYYQDPANAIEYAYECELRENRRRCTSFKDAAACMRDIANGLRTSIKAVS